MVMIKMTFNELLADYHQRFPKHGSFELRKGERISKRSKEEGVPEEPGVYLIFGCKKKEFKLLYIGKAGTLRKNGSFKNQGLRGRLNAKQKDMSRQKYYQERIEYLNLDALVFGGLLHLPLVSVLFLQKLKQICSRCTFDENNRLPHGMRAFSLIQGVPLILVQ
ncbi:MAG: hypothetical protein QHH75_09515 [Bacillota bacterium]|nr:hypothetical protein [Bacillota bacterium]